MFHFLKIGPETLYVHLTKEELTALGIDIGHETMHTKNQVMEMIMQSLITQEDLPIESPISVNVCVTKEGMQILVSLLTLPELGSEFWKNSFHDTEGGTSLQTTQVYSFAEFEDILSLAKLFSLDIAETILTHLYVYESTYYLLLHFFQAENVDEMEDACSLVAEYGVLSNMTPSRLEEYGRLIIEDVAIEDLRVHFL